MTNLFDLTGRVGLITGGTSGIGLGMAEGLGQHGAGVAIWGRNADKLAAAKARLEKTGADVLAQQVDVGDEAAVKQAMAEILAHYGRLDFACANAGISVPTKSVFDLSEGALQQIEQININGVLYTLRAAAAHMVDRAKAGDPGGSLAAVASTAAVHGAARNAHYGATKGAVVSMCRALAVELARYNITCNSILPGWIRSEMTAASQGWDKFNENVISRVPNPKGWGDPEDFAALAVYLASPASSYHTGDDIVVDGGYTIY